MSYSERVLDQPCPHCGGKVTSWYASDCMSSGGGVVCENQSKYQCSLTLAWEEWLEYV